VTSAWRKLAPNFSSWERLPVLKKLEASALYCFCGRSVWLRKNVLCQMRFGSTYEVTLNPPSGTSSKPPLTTE
jgi:hypothetical protein